MPFEKNNQKRTSKNMISVKSSQTRMESLITNETENECSSNFIAFIVPYRSNPSQMLTFKF